MSQMKLTREEWQALELRLSCESTGHEPTGVIRNMTNEPVAAYCACGAYRYTPNRQKPAEPGAASSAPANRTVMVDTVIQNWLE